MIRVKIEVQDQGQTITVQDTIRDDQGAMEVLMSRAYAVWRAALSAD